MNYILPCTVNGRRVQYLDLVDAAESAEHATPPSFVVALSGGGMPLVAVQRSEVAKTLTHGATDVSIADCTARATWDADAGRAMLIISIPTTAAAPQRAVVLDEADLYGDADESKPTTQQAPKTSDDSALIVALRPGLRLQFSANTADLCLALYLDRPGKLTPADALHFDVEIRLENSEGAAASTTLSFHAVPPESLVEAALDFGSEASQAWERRERYHGTVLSPTKKALPLFARVREALPGTSSQKRYIQQDGDSPAFYKSLFFVRKTLHPEAGVPPHFLPAEAENLRMLVEADAFNDLGTHFHQLPNLKLVRSGAEAPGIHFETLRPDGRTREKDFAEIRSQAYGSILKTLVAAWLEPALEEAAHPLYARLTLLVPNIYDTPDLHDTLGVLGDSFRRLQKESPYGENLAGWEVLTISESDAAFLGFSGRKKGLRTDPSAYYIVVDCGKGTTDFSIIRAGGPGQPAEPLYRNGFAGAGNLISYAVFQTVMAYLAEVSYSPEVATAFVREQVARGNAELKLRLASEIDRLKTRFRPDADKARVSAEWAAAKEAGGRGANTFSSVAGSANTLGELSVLEDLLGQVSGVCDWYGYIAESVAGIVAPVAADLAHMQRALAGNNLHCAGVFLTGRGFLFEPLRRRMTEELRRALSLGEGAVHAPAAPEDYKSISVEGVIGSPFVLKPDVVGWPVVVDAAPPEEVESAPEKGARWLAWATNLADSLGGALEWVNRKARTVRSVQSTDALAAVAADFNRYTLRLGDRDLRPRKQSFQQDDHFRYDLLFSPRHGIVMRRLQRDTGRFDDYSGFESDDAADTLAATADPYAAAAARRTELLPSLFPASLQDMAPQLAELVKKHTG